MKRLVIVSLIVASITLVIVTSVGARPMPFQSPLPPLCPPGQTSPGCVPWRPTPDRDQPAQQKDKEPTVTPTVTLPAVLPVTGNIVTPARRVTRFRNWRR